MTTETGQTETPVLPRTRGDGAAVDRGGGVASSKAAGRRRRVWPVVTGAILCVVAVVLLAGGGWALWKDRVDRDGKGFVSFGTTELQTDQYAIVGDLRGDGPQWLYGETLLGDARVRATSQDGRPLFVGIARTDDVSHYLEGAGYATVDGFEVSGDTTRPGGRPAHAPAHMPIWEASTDGTGQQTLFWTPRGGDWSIVFMNADASAAVEVRGDAAAELPILPWLAGGLLIAAGASGLIGSWVLMRGTRAQGR